MDPSENNENSHQDEEFAEYEESDFDRTLTTEMLSLTIGQNTDKNSDTNSYIDENSVSSTSSSQQQNSSNSITINNFHFENLQNLSIYSENSHQSQASTSKKIHQFSKSSKNSIFPVVENIVPIYENLRMKNQKIKRENAEIQEKYENSKKKFSKSLNEMKIQQQNWNRNLVLYRHRQQSVAITIENLHQIIAMLRNKLNEIQSSDSENDEVFEDIFDNVEIEE
ncbi:hypothetical protein PVAND_016884 [Polypedilum vanderplanki]|uniref:Uncharacterized protein n=1 Tax=Polypedilum vanderplanki TaxID=319348 RepID=A0A9J6BGQ3_POLVA|nr:hypothetical protein PVAND_016884 [Polypedilum vanderplanki]